MSFAKTTTQIENETKDVTRRPGWDFLNPGDLLQPIRKGQGLAKGEKVSKIAKVLRVVSVRREPNQRLLDDPAYGAEEMRREGGRWTAEQFVEMFEREGIPRTQPMTRIEFEYVHQEDRDGRAQTARQQQALV
jgi:hypothetical protein